MTPLFQIVLPEEDHHGNSYEGAHIAFRAECLTIAGGFTQGPSVHGAWDDDTGETHYDVCTPYNVACDAGSFGDLLNQAFKLFPDQLAIFSAQIGEARITARAAAQPAKAA